MFSEWNSASCFVKVLDIYGYFNKVVLPQILMSVFSTAIVLCTAIFANTTRETILGFISLNFADKNI